MLIACAQGSGHLLISDSYEVILLQWARFPERQFQCVELFSGQGNLSRAFRQAGKRVASYDLELGGEMMDFTRPSGFLLRPQRFRSIVWPL